MAEKFKVNVNENFTFEFDRKEVEALDLRESKDSQVHVLNDAKSVKAEVLISDFHNKKYSVAINGNTYEINIANKLDLLIEEMGLSLGTSTLVNDIKAPMPGIILEVAVKPGDTVKEGDNLLILEAMKMENTLNSSRDGVIKSVEVSVGQTVDKNQLLIEME